MHSWTYGALNLAPCTQLSSKQCTNAGTEEFVRKKCIAPKINNIDGFGGLVVSMLAAGT
jgi:hypothetical protein